MSIGYFIYLWPVCTVIVLCVEWVHLAYRVPVYTHILDLGPGNGYSQWFSVVIIRINTYKADWLSPTLCMIQLVRFQITPSILTDIVIPPVLRINTCINSNMTLFDLSPPPLVCPDSVYTQDDCLKPSICIKLQPLYHDDIYLNHSPLAISQILISPTPSTSFHLPPPVYVLSDQFTSLHLPPCVAQPVLSYWFYDW